MDFASIRSRLAGAEGRLYWRSLSELSDSQDFRDYLHREFPAQASEWNDPTGRRNFLKLMSASLALAGVGACTRQPPEEIVPYVRQPEDLVPGRPLFFASAIPISGIARPVLVESHMGRPTKIEGNPDHPASLGAADAVTQAAVLGLYDPDRAQTLTNRGEVRTWSACVGAIQTALGAQKATKGTGLRILTEPVTSPSLAELLATTLQEYPAAKWHQYDPVGSDGARTGIRQAHGSAANTVYHLDKADVVLSLEADFLSPTSVGSLRYTRDFADRRRVTDDNKHMNRLYVVESSPTLTGAKAEHRLSLKASEIEGFARRLATTIGAGAASSAVATPAPGGELVEKWIAAVAKDLQGHRGRSVVVAGEYQPAAVHALAHAMNQALGNVDATVTYGPPIEAQTVDGHASLAELSTAMDAGQVQLLVILGVNPVFTAPADLKFAERLAKVGMVVYHSLYLDETSELAHWNVPATHPLETLGRCARVRRNGDAHPAADRAALRRPLGVRGPRGAVGAARTQDARPRQGLLDARVHRRRRMDDSQRAGRDVRQRRDVLAQRDPRRIHRRNDRCGDVVRTGAQARGPPRRRAATDAAAAASPATPGTPAPPRTAPAEPAPAAPVAPAPTPTPAPAPQTAGGLELIFRPDPHVLDGRYANNGWLQEAPKPLTKLTWDTAAWISPRLAESRGLDRGDVIELRYRGLTARMPVFIVPGQPDESVTIFFGYGRRMSGRVGTASEQAQAFNAFRLRTSDAPWFGSGLEIARTGERYLLATTQDHHAMEGRAPARVGTLAQYEADPEVFTHMGGHVPPKTLTMFPAKEYEGNKWGMAIDLTSCTGCGACVVACVAENNIPVVGKEQVNVNREMHWIRVDHYFTGDIDRPESLQAVHQPVPCMQCENAPCEVVCPVAATTHSSEGLNDMVYNRCVGTRYCSNNCPYKVRRFNFLLYSDWNTQSYYSQRNPDVTVRSRGVMEKCTYCVQRINHARIDAKKEDRAIRDGEIVTACEATCPADAIVFGDLNDANSRVSKLKAQHRNYGMLEDLDTRPRTTYLASLRNPNPELEPTSGQRTTGH